MFRNHNQAETNQQSTLYLLRSNDVF